LYNSIPVTIVGMKYLVKSVSIFDSSVFSWKFTTKEEAKQKVRELKDTGSNYFIVSLYELEPINS
tara:strand:+ start:4802 stop:4996 length:195 start_codon:yes stop_codon:yes gene_type:complete